MKENSVEQIWNEFWKPMLEKDGVINVEQLKKELADFYYLMHQVPKVYMHITGGRMSKIFYDADTVIQLADEYQQEQFEEWKKDEPIGCDCSDGHDPDCKKLGFA